MLKYNWFYYITLTILFLIVYPYIFDAKLFLGGDNASYYSLGRSIADNFEYVSSEHPNPKPANHYPPGYPFILAIAMKIGVSSLIGLKIVNGLFMLGSVILTFLLSFRFSNNKIFAGLIAVASLFNYHLLEYSSITMSELPFVFFILLTFYAFIKFVDSNYKFKSASFIITIIGIIALVYIRTQGIAVLGAFVFYLLLEKRFKIAGIFILSFIIGYLPWQLRSQKIGNSSYVTQLFKVNPYLADSKKMEVKDWGTRVKNNAIRYVSKEIPSLIFPTSEVVYNDPKTGLPVPANGKKWVLGITIMAFSIFGIWKMKQVRWLLLSFFGANFLIFMLWPDVWFGIRFILPMTPLILIAVFVGIKHLIQLFIKADFVSSGKIYPLLILPYLLVIFPGVKKLHTKAEGKHAPNWGNFLSVATYANEKLKSSDVVITRKPELFYFISDRKTKTFPYTSDLDIIKEDFKQNRVTHVVVEQLGFSQTGKFLYPLLQKEPDRFNLVYSLGSRDAVDKDGNKVKTQDGVWLYEYSQEKGYSGVYKDGLKQGEGTYNYFNGSKFEGSWENDTINGPGVLQEANGQLIKGTWKKGKREGKFYLTIPSTKQTIEAYFKDDKIEKQGYYVDSLYNRKGLVNLF